MNGYHSQVSIHAPARGATRCQKVMFQSTRPRGATSAHANVSIHAPARGATIGESNVDRAVRCFNPRARAGRDASSSSIRGQRLVVSIHAPARGATYGSCCGHPMTNCFNPRARAGRDTRDSWLAQLRLAGFNPRARAGRDPWRCSCNVRL